MTDLEELHADARLFYECHSDSPAQQKLADLISDVRIDIVPSRAIATAKYNPTRRHSEDFCWVSGDNNPIHQQQEGHSEVISPGFLQTCVAHLLTRETAARFGGSYPFTMVSSKMSGVLMTGQDYSLDADVHRLSEDSIEAKAVFRDSEGKEVCRFDRKSYANRPKMFFPQINPNELIQCCTFRLPEAYNLLEFSELIGAGKITKRTSPETNLLALAASSYAPCRAKKEGRLAIGEGVIALYAGQNICLDSSRSANLRHGLDLELYVSDKERFGKKSVPGEFVRMQVVARGVDRSPIYAVESALSFQDKRLLDVMVRRAQRVRK